MATGTGPLTSQDVLNRVWFPAGTAPTADPEKIAVYIAGGSAQIGSGSSQASTQPRLVIESAWRQVQLHAAGAITGSGEGTATTGLGGYSVLNVYLRPVTATGTVSTIDIFVESRLDGTNWVGLGAFNQLTSATGATFDQVIRLVSNGSAPGYGSAIAVRSDPGAGTIRQIGWGDDLRIRRDVSGGTTNPSFSYAVWVNAVG